MDTNRIKTLIQKREDIDKELVELVTGSTPDKKQIKCSICGGPHTARTCEKKQPQTLAEVNGHTE